MIPEIGLLVAGYIGVRLIHLLARQDVVGLVKAFAVLTLVVTILISIDLIMKAISGVPTLPGLPTVPR